MGILADVFVAKDDDARSYEQRLIAQEPLEPPVYERVEYKRITSLELGMLWALLQEQPWDVKKHKFVHIQHDDETGSCLDAFPTEFISLLAALDDEKVSTGSAAWANSEELQWPAADAAEVITDLVRLARLAQTSGRGMYVWNCP